MNGDDKSIVYLDEDDIAYFMPLTVLRERLELYSRPWLPKLDSYLVWWKDEHNPHIIGDYGDLVNYMVREVRSFHRDGWWDCPFVLKGMFHIGKPDTRYTKIPWSQ